MSHKSLRRKELRRRGLPRRPKSLSHKGLRQQKYFSKNLIWTC